MAEKTPIRTVFDEGGNATGLAEFQSGEFIGVTYGGIGTNTLTTNSILLGNGTSAVQESTIQISGNTISSSDSSLITINDGLSISGGLTVSGTITGTISSSSSTLGNVQVGVTGANEIDTSSGNLTIDSAGGTVTVDDNLVVSGNLTVSGTTTTVNSTTIDIQNSLRFEGSSSNDFETNITVTDPTADRTITFPDATGNVALFATAPTAAITDGTSGQVLSTDGSGALSFTDVSTNLKESTLSTAPASEGDFDLSFDPTQSTQETPFEVAGTDAFGVALGSNKFSYNDPEGTTDTIDLGAFA